jgi:putative ABC transport system permease protein
MFSLQRTLSVGYLGQHPTRAILVVLSIALGVATLVATQSLNRGLGEAAQRGNNPLADLGDLVIVNGQTGVPRELAAKLRAAGLDGVGAVYPVVMERVALPELDSRRRVWLFGFEFGQEKDPAGANRLPPGIHLELDDEVGVLGAAFLPWAAAVGRELADDMARAPKIKGRAFTVRTSVPRKLVKVGTIRFDGALAPLNSMAVGLKLPDAAKIVFPKRPGFVNQISVKLADGANLEVVRQGLTDWLDRQRYTAQVETREQSRALNSDVTAGLELGFAIGGAGALVIGLFLVYNALSVSVAERRHDIGILRSTGATRGQVVRLFVAEAAVLGLAGSLLGLPLGYFLARLVVDRLARVVSELLVQLDQVSVDASPRLLGLAVLAGTLVAVAAGLVPALQAAREEPAEAVRRVPRRHGVGFLLLHLAAVAVLLAVGCAFVGLRHKLPVRFGVFAGGAFLFVAGVAATPLLARVVGRLVQPVFRHLLGLEGRLAADNLVRSPGRTGIVIAALAATGALMVQTAGFLRSTEVAIRTWIDEKIAADLFISSGSATTSASNALAMREDIRQELLGVRGVEAVLPIRSHRVSFNNFRVYLIALDMDTFDRAGQHQPLARSLRRFPEVRRPGNVLVSENFAALHKVAVGQRITIPGPERKTVELKVVGTVTDYSWNRGTILLDRAWFRKEFADNQVDLYDIFLAADADEQAVKKEIEDRWGKKEALFVMTRDDVQSDIRDQLRRIYGMAYAQEAIVGLVALLGVVSALFISVLQRRRELGLLRAVGASRAHVLRSVLAEAVLMGIVGAAVGFAIGLVLEWYVLDWLVLDESGFRFPMRVPWAEAGVVAAGSVALATLAGLWPAYHATRLRIPEAIAYE